MPIQYFRRSIRYSLRYTIKMFDSTSFCGLPLHRQQYSKTISTELPPDKCFAQKMDRQKAVNLDYEAAIATLNSLQSNAATIRKSVNSGTQRNNVAYLSEYLNRSGMSLEQLDKLSIIHVSGTKGKGTTCALTESILNEHGVQTGFYSSPHLISVTERFRINGRPISMEDFTKSFWPVYDALDKTKKHEKDMPAYFHFLTILCFHIFLKKNVDVAIIEVGIGGKYDSTNIIRNTKIVGITSLGLEHTQLLGDSLDKIANQKAGIIKNNCSVYTNVEQTECLQIIKEKAQNRNASFVIVPDISEYKWPDQFDVNKLNKNIILNISLAIQLAKAWLQQYRAEAVGSKRVPLSDNKTIFDISKKIIVGIEKCYWPGRCQVLKFHNLNIYLDGAHTEESLKICSEWFNKLTKDSENVKVFLFNVTGDRDVQRLLAVINRFNDFHLSCFVPNIPFKKNICNDISTIETQNDQMLAVVSHAKCWKLIVKTNEQNVQIFETILDGFEYLRSHYGTEQQLDVLVTGSLHLIGATVLALEELDIRINFKNLKQ